MENEKKFKPIRITDPIAIKFIHEQAPKQRRSLANCAAIAVISALGKRNKQNPGEPSFLGNVIVKNQGNLSSAETG
jgi:hypothetical protein